MWPSQRLDTSAEYNIEIANSVAEILYTASNIVNQARYELRFIVFPLFMAGFASSDGTQKMMAMELISSMDKESIGSNTQATQNALGMIYERQTQAFMHTGHSLDVDWADIMVGQGLQVINWGL